MARAQRAWEETPEQPLDSVLVRLGLIGEDDLANALAAASNKTTVEAGALDRVGVDSSILPELFLRQARATAIDLAPGRAVIAVADPLDQFSIRAMELFLDRPVEVRVAPASLISRALDRAFGAPETEATAPDGGDDVSDSDDAERLKDLASEAPVIRLVNQLIEGAVDRRASDVHFEGTESGLAVHYERLPAP